MKTEYKGFEIEIDIKDTAQEWITTAQVSKVKDGKVEECYPMLTERSPRTTGGLNAGLHMLEVVKNRIDTLLIKHE